MPDPATSRAATNGKPAKVKAHVAELERTGPLRSLQYSSDARDPWKVLNQGLVAIVRVAQSNDAYYAFEAGKFLVDYAMAEIAKREAQKIEADGRAARVIVNAPTPEREQIISELRGLYAKALGQPQPSQAPLVVESEPER